MNEFKKLIMMAQQGVDDGNDADYPPYLCFQALESDFSVALGGDWHNNVCQYSFNRRDWFDLPARTYTPAIGILQKVYFKGELSPPGDGSIYTFGIFYSKEKKYRLSGSPTSMLYGDECAEAKPLPKYAFSCLFSHVGDNVVSISNDFLKYVKCSGGREFWSMFQSSNLSGSVCIYDVTGESYSGAFGGTKIDEVLIHTDKIGWGAFQMAFQGTNITSLNLPARTPGAYGYSKVATNCKKLKTVFVNLRKVIPSTIPSYVQSMDSAFKGCESLSEVYFMSLEPPVKNQTNNWLTGVAEEGVIILNKFATWNPEDYRNGDEIETEVDGVITKETITWGIPKNWKVKYCDPVTLEVKENRDDFKVYGDYMTLEYIQTNGNQYLDSQIVLSANSRIEIDARLTTSTSTTSYVLYGNTYDSNNRITLNPTNGDNATSRFDEKPYEGNLYRSGRHVWSSDRNGIYIDGEIIGKWDGNITDFEHTTSFYILADRISTGTGYQLRALTGTRIYGLKVYENGRLAAEMVPALSISQSKPGLYDKVNKRFLTNIGTGEFTYQ